MDSLNTLVSDSLDTIPGMIEYAELNYVMNLLDVPNDDFISDQGSLVNDGVHTDAHINLNPAWDIMLNDQNDMSGIKVGIVEGDAVDFRHEDFGNGTFVGSVVKGGKDFSNQTDISNITIFGPHATACAGIIGAIRYNNKGIAGIAGGDAHNSEQGVSLYSLSAMTSSNNVAVFYSDIASAITFGAASTTGGKGYGLHIENNSYGNPESKINSKKTYGLLQDAVKSAYDNHCVFIASRGNFYTNNDNPVTPNTSKNNEYGIISVTDKIYPACYSNPWVISVGASGDDGDHKVGGTAGNGDYTYESMYNNDVDLIAPGALNIVVTTTTNGEQYGDAYSDTKYTRFSGTSSSSPHVAGVAALMLSHHNISNGYPDNLDNTDVERLLKSYTTAASGGSEKVGSGKLNAGAVLTAVDVNHHYWVQHNRGYSESQSVTDGIVLVSPPVGTLATGYYHYYRTAVVRTYTINAAFYSYAPDIIDKWLRHEVVGTGSTVATSFDRYADFQTSVSGNTITVTITTYCWTIYNYVNGQLAYATVTPSQLSTDFSLHLYDADVNSVENITPEEQAFAVYPNPASDIAHISFVTEKEVNAKIEVVSLEGSVIQRYNKKMSKGGYLFDLNVADLPNGIYMVNFKGEKTIFTKKIVVVH